MLADPTSGVSHLLNTSSNRDQSDLVEENSKLRLELEKLYIGLQRANQKNSILEKTISDRLSQNVSFRGESEHISRDDLLKEDGSMRIDNSNNDLQANGSMINAVNAAESQRNLNSSLKPLSLENLPRQMEIN